MLHGPAELLPISSSGHTTLIPWLLGWDYAEEDPELRKALEVALHGGAAAALLVARRRELADQLRHLDGRQLTVITVASAPVALAGWWFERPIETRLGTPMTIAAGLLAGALAMALADRSHQQRRAGDAGPLDGLWLGLAQACALVPGVSRNGATLAAARALGFSRREAEVLSRRLAYPVIGGASLLKARRLWEWDGAPRPTAELIAGALSSFGSTLLTARRLDAGRGERRLLPYSLYRSGLALISIGRIRGRLGRSAQDQGQATST